MISTITKTSYVYFAKMLFKQTKGISMGASCSPIIADLVLSKLEYDFLIRPENYGIAKRLRYTKRYIDDILSIGTSALKDEFPRIYPPSLPLNFDQPQGTKIHFLDLHIDVETGSRTVFDKRRDFPFEVITMPFKDSNQPIQIGLNVFFSQMLRFAKICSTATEMEENVKILTATMLKRGFTSEELHQTASKLQTLYPTPPII